VNGNPAGSLWACGYVRQDVTNWNSDVFRLTKPTSHIHYCNNLLHE
jgi:hypothetical protein